MELAARPKAARTRESDKHRRYPGAGFVAAAIEGGGRMVNKFQSFLLSQAPIDEDRRGPALCDVKQSVAVALQRGIAAMLLGSAGSKLRPWASACQTLGQGAARRRRHT